MFIYVHLQDCKRRKLSYPVELVRDSYMWGANS